MQRAFDSWFYLIWINFFGVVFFCFLKHLKGSFRRVQILIRWRQTHLWCRKIKISSNFIPMGKNLFKIITEDIIKTNCTCWNLTIKKWEQSVNRFYFGVVLLTLSKLRRLYSGFNATFEQVLSSEKLLRYCRHFYG